MNQEICNQKEELNQFKKQMDGWIKEILAKIEQSELNNALVTSQAREIDHNYELIQEMRCEMNKLKEEMSVLRLIQILN